MPHGLAERKVTTVMAEKCRGTQLTFSAAGDPIIAFGILMLLLLCLTAI